MKVEEVIFDLAELLRVPVLVLVLAALALVLVEAGAFAVELGRRRRRDTARLEQAAVRAREALRAGRPRRCAGRCSGRSRGATRWPPRSR